MQLVKFRNVQAQRVMMPTTSWMLCLDNMVPIVHACLCVVLLVDWQTLSHHGKMFSIVSLLWINPRHIGIGEILCHLIGKAACSATRTESDTDLFW